MRMRQDVLKPSSICLMVPNINLQKYIWSRPLMIGVVYIHLLAVLRFMKSSVSHGKTVKSAFLVILMIIMTQVGYLDLINSPRTGNDSFDDDSSVMETGGSGSSNILTPSVEGADLIIGEAMEDITFQYNSSQASMPVGVPVGILSGCPYIEMLSLIHI